MLLESMTIPLKSSSCENTLQLLHNTVAPAEVAVAYSHSYSRALYEREIFWKNHQILTNFLTHSIFFNDQIVCNFIPNDPCLLDLALN